MTTWLVLLIALNVFQFGLFLWVTHEWAKSTRWWAARCRNYHRMIRGNHEMIRAYQRIARSPEYGTWSGEHE